MSYQVLARKWRPNKFAELVGQDHVVTAISHALDNDRLHHAYLFTGTRGVGKTTIARIFSKSLNCDEGQSAEPCGRCDTCLSIEQGNFVDLLEIDAASRTKVEDTRELLDNVQYKPTRGRFKVYLIDEVHMLSKHSFNALLKTLEEPPPHVKFLLATTDPQKLPVTILSRCLQFNLKALSREQIGKQLSYILGEENIQFEPAALSLLARAAQGSMRDALSLTDQAIAQGNNQVVKAIVTDMLGLMDKQLLLKLLNGVVEKQKSQVLQLVEQLSEQSPDYAQVLAELSSILHQIALTQWEPEACKLETTSARAVFAMAKKLTAEHVQLLYKITLEGVKEIPWSVDGRTCLEMTLLRMTSFAPTFTPSTPSDDGFENNNERQQVIQQGPEDSGDVTAENSGSQNDVEQVLRQVPSQTSEQTLDQIDHQTPQQASEENAQFSTTIEPFSEQASVEAQSVSHVNSEVDRFEPAYTEQANTDSSSSQSGDLQATNIDAVEHASSQMDTTPQDATHLDVAHADNGHFDNRSQEQIAQDSFYDEHSVHHMEIEQQQLEQTKQDFYQPDALPTEQLHHQQPQASVEQSSPTSEFEKTQALLALRKSLSESSEKQVPKKEGTTQVKKPLFPPKTLSNNRPEAEGIAPESFASELKAPEISIEQAGQSQPPPWELGQHDEQVESFPQEATELTSESLSGNEYQQPSAEESLNNSLANSVSPSSVSSSGNIDTNGLKPFLDSGEKLIHASQVNDWSAMIERSSLNGLDKQIALNATCVQQGDKLDLLVDKSQEHLISDSSMAQLTESLSTLMGKALSVDIQLGDPSGTPSHIQEQITRIRQSHAKHVVKTDECIQNLISAFDGTVDTDSIRAR